MYTPATTLAELRSRIDTYIKTNGIGAITGQLHNDILNNFVDLVEVGDGTPIEVVELTYSALFTLYNTNALVPRQTYLITDFQTLHVIENTVERNDTNKTIPVEQLLVQAVSTNALAPLAISLNNLADYIEYDITSDYLSALKATGHKGCITKRIDYQANKEFPCDFRACVVRRWDFDFTPYGGDGIIFALPNSSINIANDFSGTHTAQKVLTSIGNSNDYFFADEDNVTFENVVIKKTFDSTKPIPNIFFGVDVVSDIQINTIRDGVSFVNKIGVTGSIQDLGVQTLHNSIFVGDNYHFDGSQGTIGNSLFTASIVDTTPLRNIKNSAILAVADPGADELGGNLRALKNLESSEILVSGTNSTTRELDALIDGLERVKIAIDYTATPGVNPSSTGWKLHLQGLKPLVNEFTTGFRQVDLSAQVNKSYVAGIYSEFEKTLAMASGTPTLNIDTLIASDPLGGIAGIWNLTAGDAGTYTIATIESYAGGMQIPLKFIPDPTIILNVDTNDVQDGFLKTSTITTVADGTLKNILSCKFESTKQRWAAYIEILGSGDVSSTGSITDNRLIRGDVGAKNIQESGITVTDTDEIQDVSEIVVNGVRVHRVIGDTLTTGIIAGGFLSINGGDGTKFDISAGSGLVIDQFTDPENPVIKLVEWTAFVGLTPTHAALLVTYIAIDDTGAVVQQDHDFTAAEKRDLITIGAPVTQDGVNIGNVSDLSHFAASSYLADDLADSIGIINESGNNFMEAATDLTIRKEAGVTFTINANRFLNPKDPHHVTTGVISPATFTRLYGDGAGGPVIEFPQTTINPEQWDDGSGVLQTVPNNQWTNQLIFFIPSGTLVLVQYGEETYASLADAEAALTSLSFTSHFPSLTGTLVRTVLTIKKGTTDLSDSSLAVFTATGKFGLGTGGGGAAGGTFQDMQDTYNNSVSPEIITDGTRQAVQFQQGSGADTDTVFEVLNGAGGLAASIAGDGLYDGAGVKTQLETAIKAAENTTYANLIALIGGNNLIPFKHYRITDHQTIHEMHNTTDPNTTNLTIPTEPLVVMALTDAILAPRAFSDLHPTDILEYKVAKTTWGDLEHANSMGYISYRKSAKGDPVYDNVQAPLDFRYCGYRRGNCQDLYRKTGLQDNYVIPNSTSITVGKSFANAAGQEVWTSDSVKITNITAITGAGTADINLNGTDYEIDLSGGVEAGIDAWIAANQATINVLLAKVLKTGVDSMDLYYPNAWADATFTETLATATATVNTTAAQKDEQDTFMFFAGDLEGSAAAQDIIIEAKAWHVDTGNPLINFTASKNIFREVKIKTISESTITRKCYHLHNVNAMSDYFFVENVNQDGYWGYSNHGSLIDSIVTVGIMQQDIESTSIHRKDGQGTTALDTVHTFVGQNNAARIIRCTNTAVEILAGGEQSFIVVEDNKNVSVPMVSDNPHNPSFFKKFNGERYESVFGSSFKDLAAITGNYPAGQAEPIEFDFDAKISNLRTTKTITGLTNIPTLNDANGYDDFCSYFNLTSTNATESIITMDGFGDREGFTRYLIPEAGLKITVGTNDASEGFVQGINVSADGDKNETIRCVWNPVIQRWYADLGDLASVNSLEIKGLTYSSELDNGDSGTADTINWTARNYQKSTLTGNCTYTFTAPTGPTNGVFRLIQGGVGNFTVTWPATVKWPGGTAPTLSTAIAAVDVISFYFDGTNYHCGFLLDSK